jgi:hypothetical protein
MKLFLLFSSLLGNPAFDKQPIWSERQRNEHRLEQANQLVTTTTPATTTPLLLVKQKRQ